MNFGTIWMGPWVVWLACGLEAHKEQALMGLYPHACPTLLMKGYIVFFASLKGLYKNRLYVCP